MTRHVAIDAPELDALVEEAIAGIGADVAAKRVPGLRGVVLGGGYARGEGGAIDAGGGRLALSNDLDFHVIARDDASPAVLRAIDEALAPVSRRWSARLGVDADFSPAKTVARMKRDEARIMVQELVRGYEDCAGEKGETMFAEISRIPLSRVPWTEAVRLVANRGFGLLLARESADPLFVARNVAKCVLSCGDAMLVLRGAYCYSVRDRAQADGSPEYAAAMQWKFRPLAEPPVPWEKAREILLRTAGAVFEQGRRSGEDRLSLRQTARWLARRRTLGPPATLGRDCTVRLAREVVRHVERGLPVSPALRADWQIFN